MTGRLYWQPNGLGNINPLSLCFILSGGALQQGISLCTLSPGESSHLHRLLQGCKSTALVIQHTVHDEGDREGGQSETE